MQDSPFLQVVSSIQTILQPYIALNTERPVPRHAPLFDPRVAPPLQDYSTDVFHQISALGLPAELSAELATMLTDERANHQRFIESERRHLLEELSVLTISSNPSAIPSSVDAACGAFYNLTVDSGLESVRKHLGEFSLQGDSTSDHSDSDEGSSSGDEDGDDLEPDMEIQEVDDDENTPMKPGEEVPPLDTKYLPIFEALHERGKVLTKPEKTYLVNMTGMTYRQITIWFQNRRRGELKEDLQLHASSSHAASVHSLDSSDASEDEMDLEQRFSNVASDTTFDIRSWRLTSALPAKKPLQGSSFPSSPTKLTFGSSATISGSDTDDTDLSDLSDDEANLPPGLQVPSLSTSFTTADTASLATSRSLLGPTIPVQNTSSGVSLSAISRPVKPLPPSRRTSPQARGPRAPAQQAPAFSFNFAGSASAPAQNQFLPTSAPMPAQPAQFVTSNERGLTVEMDTTPPTSTASLQPSSAPPAPAANSFANSSISAALLPSSPPLSAGSPHSASSPTPPAQTASSPRPAVKPLPRRTGCAPRPRPPPRTGSVSTPATTPAPASTSARSSVVLPPSSNPSLGNTTLGALLRPNPPAPKIPTQMEDRLSAMAGRMGVGSSSSLARRGTAADAAALARASISPDASSFPTRGSSFAFGPTTLPGIHALSGPTLAPVSGQQAQSPTTRSPSS